MGNLYPQRLLTSRKRMEAMLNRQEQPQQSDLVVRAAMEIEHHRFAPEIRSEVIRLLKQILVECAVATAAATLTDE
jgi:hypothetical protein